MNESIKQLVDDCIQDPIHISLTTSNNVEIDWLQSGLDKLRIHYKITQLQPNELFHEKSLQQSDIIISGFSIDLNREASIISLFYKLKSLLPDKYQKLIQVELDQAMTHHETGTRNKVYNRIKQILLENSFINILYSKQLNTIAEPEIVASIDSQPIMIDFSKVWIKK